MDDSSETKVYIPLCGKAACEKELKRIAEIVTRCRTTHKITGKYSMWFEQHFNENSFTVIHFCSDLWSKAKKFQQLLEDDHHKVILLNLDLTHVKAVDSGSRSDEDDLKSLTQFFRDFGSECRVTCEEELLKFTDKVRGLWLAEGDLETTSVEDEGYCQSDKSSTTSPAYTGSNSPTKPPCAMSPQLTDNVQGAAAYNVQGAAAMDPDEDFEDENPLAQEKFETHPDIFGQTDHQYVRVKMGHFNNYIPDTPIYESGKQSRTGNTINTLHKKLLQQDSQQDSIALNKLILSKILPEIYQKKDLPALASVCTCKDIKLKKRALILMELCIWEGLSGRPDNDLTLLCNAESKLHTVLIELHESYTRSHEIVFLTLLERAANVYLMILSAIVMSSKHSEELTHTCRSYFNTIQTRPKNPKLTSNTSDKSNNCFTALARFVDRSQDFRKVKDKVLLAVQTLTGDSKRKADKCAQNLFTCFLIEQVSVTFTMVQKVFESGSESDETALKFLQAYLQLVPKGLPSIVSPRNSFRGKKEPESVCIVMVFRALTLFLKHHLLHFAHKDVENLCQRIIGVLQAASDRDLPYEVVRSLHSLLFHPNSVIRSGVVKILERNKHRIAHNQYLINEIVGILDPLLSTKAGESQILFKEPSWKALRGKFGSKDVVLMYHTHTEKDHQADTRMSLESHKDICFKEMQHLINLQHPNIVELMAYQSLQVPRFYIMEDCTLPLQNAMQNFREHGRFFTQGELYQFLLAGVSALQYCHKENVIHRNLTAQCLAYYQDKTVKLCSFGLCVQVGASPIIDYAKAIPFRWSAPESLFKNEYSKASDIWMLGILMYEVMTHGVLPFWNLSDLDLGNKLHERSVRLFSENCLGEGMANLINECISYDPERRPYIQNVKTRIEAIIQESIENPKTLDNVPYPKCDMNQRIPSTIFTRGLPFALRSSEKISMDPTGQKVSDILYRIAQNNEFRERVIHSMPHTVRSLFGSQEIKAIITQTITPYQSPESEEYLISQVPCSKSLMIEILEGRVASLQKLLEVVFQVAVKMCHLHSHDVVLGDLYADAVYLHEDNHQQVYIVSLAFMKGPDRDQYQIYSQPEIPDFMVARADPELIQGNNFSPKSDVYSFGCFLWEVLSALDSRQSSAYVNDKNVKRLFENLSAEEIKSKSAVLKCEWESYNPKPSCCPDIVYQLIRSCISDDTERPTINHVLMKLKEYYKQLFNATLEQFDSAVARDPSDVYDTGNDTLSVCNGSSVLSSQRSDSYWGSEFSSVVTLGAVNLSVDGADKYVDVDYDSMHSQPTDDPQLTYTIQTNPQQHQQRGGDDDDPPEGYANDSDDNYEFLPENEKQEEEEEIYHAIVEYESPTQPPAVPKSKPPVAPKPTTIKKKKFPSVKKPKPDKKPKA